MSTDLFADAMSLNASLNASEAAAQSRKAAHAARETLGATGHNPFVTLESVEFDSVNGEGFFGFLNAKEKVQTSGKKISLKRTDIGHLVEKTDDFGTVYTKVYLEDGCSLDEEYVCVPGSMENVQTYINNQ